MQADGFYLGTHEPGWLKRAPFRLCVARQRLWRDGRSVPEARSPWMLDSGAYMTQRLHGGWTVTPDEYLAIIRRARDEIGNLEWAAPMDWPCEPEIRARTGKTTLAHQHLTSQNVIDLKMKDPALPIKYVLQGWEPEDWARHAEMYASPPYSIDLSREDVVGVGGLCRMQDTDKAGQVLKHLEPFGLSLHGFGFKMQGLVKYGDKFTRADSLAWSYNARKNPPLPQCTHQRCNNCYERAVWWRSRLLRKLGIQDEP
jgi:hypothetical protein